ncbi:hypothetical protein CYMTET_24349 [Cymbomonas tetramitiformis]|uniref:Uncharacterized protein n=1 Tax=Cymbomonas tetramitiformis TaxID=36881 RepID=A0AAE0FWA1_9CHLO|nr:hypothetical protein CYMTET_24349 [Cymbomonas tetramitiformis]
MACAVLNKSYCRALGCSPWEFRHNAKPATILSSHIPADHASSSSTDPEAPRPISAADVATISTTIRQEALLHHHQYQNTYDGKGIVRDSHIRVGDLVTVRIPDATRATKTKSKVLGFTKSHPYLCIGLVGKAVRLKDVLHGTPMEKPIPRTQCHIFRRALDSSLVQMEATLVQMKPDIEEAFAQNELRYSLLKEKLANRPDAPVCTSCKKPTDRYYALRMCHPCYSKHAYQRLKSKVHP